jgi:hypothetical protein
MFSRADRLRVSIVVLIATVLSLMFFTIGHAQGILPASTGCSGDSVTTLFRQDVQEDSIAKAELDAHEVVHRVQLDSLMHANGTSCYLSLMYSTSTAEINLSFEIPAYRAQAAWNHENRPGFNYRDFYLTVAKALYFSYDSTIPWGTIFIRLYDMKSEPWGQVSEPEAHVFSEVSRYYRVTDPLTNRLVRNWYGAGN